MLQIFGAKFNFLTIAGLMVLAAAVFIGVWKAVDYFVPERKTQVISTKEMMEHFQPRWLHEDSMAIAAELRYQDSLRYYTLLSHRSDSLLYSFYKNQQLRYESYNSVYRADIAELHREWAERYDR